MTDKSQTEDLFTYFDREARIVWLPVGRSDDVFDEETPWGSYAYDGETQKKIGFEIWATVGFPPADLLEHIPPPSKKGPSPTGGQFREDPYWDREVDIAWLPIDHHGSDIYGEERDWGLVIRNRRDDSTRALEIWSASTIFPPEILEAFPTPGDVSV